MIATTAVLRPQKLQSRSIFVSFCEEVIRYQKTQYSLFGFRNDYALTFHSGWLV